MTIEETKRFVNNQDLHLRGEVWKQHPVYIAYFASNLGRVKHFNGIKGEKIKTQSFDRQKGRFGFCIHTTHRQKHFKTARFICECFYGINDNLVVDHKNTVSYDDRLENLRFCSVTDNNNNELTQTKRKAKSRQKHAEEIAQYQSIDTENEIWEKHPNVNVEVSNMGRVRWYTTKKPERMYTSSGSYSGPEKKYLKITFHKQYFLVHRLVAETFLPNTNGCKNIRHIDGNTLNNRADNIEWCQLTDIMTRHKSHKGNTYKVASVDEGGNIVKTYKSIGYASKDGYKKWGIRGCINGKQKTHMGVKWKIIND